MTYAHYMRALAVDKAIGDALLAPVVGNPECTEELITELRKVSDGSRAWFTAYPLNGDEYGRAIAVAHPSLIIEISDRQSTVGTDREWIAACGYMIREGGA